MANFKQCTAHSKRTGERCKARAVTGSNVCYHHGGATPKGEDSPHFVHGRDSRYKQFISEKLQEKLALADDDPLDLLPELDVQRALFAEYLSRQQIGTPLTAGDINMLMQWATDIGRMVERITKQRNETALTSAEVTFLAARVADIVGKYIHDPEAQSAFVRELFTELPTANRGASSLTVGGE